MEPFKNHSSIDGRARKIIKYNEWRKPTEERDEQIKY